MLGLDRRFAQIQWERASRNLVEVSQALLSLYQLQGSGVKLSFGSINLIADLESELLEATEEQVIAEQELKKFPTMD